MPTMVSVMYVKSSDFGTCFCKECRLSFSSVDSSRVLIGTASFVGALDACGGLEDGGCVALSFPSFFSVTSCSLRRAASSLWRFTSALTSLTTSVATVFATAAAVGKLSARVFTNPPKKDILGIWKVRFFF